MTEFKYKDKTPRSEPRALIDDFGNLYVLGVEVDGTPAAVCISPSVSPTQTEVELVPIDDANIKVAEKVFYEGDEVTIKF